MKNFNQYSTFQIWKKIIKIMGSLKKKMFLLILFAVFLAIAESLINVFNKYAIDNFISAKNYETLLIFVVINVFFAICFGILVWLFIRRGSFIEANVNYILRKESFTNLQKLSFSYFDKTPQGYIMARMTSDTKKVANIVSWALLDFTWSLLFMIFTLIILFIYSIKLALIVAGCVPLFILISFVFKNKILKHNRASRKYNSDATAKFSESFLGAKTTKSLGIEEKNLEEFDEVLLKLKIANVRAISISSLFSSILLFAIYSTLALVMYAGSIDLLDPLNTSFTIGTLFLFIRATTSFFEPIRVLTTILTNLKQAQASAERIIGLIEEKSEIIDNNDLIDDNLEIKDGRIEYKNVDFYYNIEEKILEDFNLEIKEGSTISLVGRTGSGKTTLVNLLSRFYELKAGEILIDGIDYKKFKLNYLRKNIGYVLQTPHLFSSSILDNIKYGKNDASLDEVIAASKLVGAHDFIEKLPQGYNSHVGEGGNLLSVGEKQLISFARAIIKNPKILILDEATSSIDSQAERIIQLATKNILKNRTNIVIAHRLSTIINSDLIIMLDAGKIIEVGNHASLLEKKCFYYNLYKNQFSSDENF